MKVDLTTSSYYRVGGNLPPNSPSYVQREADEQLYQKLKDGEFCYVLNSRQMGKSSLWVRVKERLEKEDYVCAAIDLSGIGQGQLEQWYTSFANRLTKAFNSSVRKKWRGWWKDNNDLSPVERLHQLIEELLLPSLLDHEQLIVFIDEIDYVKGLPFSTDEFFALIRSCFNDRSINQKYNQITFCLLGVATPGDLIENKRLTPFNIGTAIELKGFCLDEVGALIKGLERKVIYPESVMSDVLYWTGGQPFLTQRLCNLVVKANNPTPDVSQIVKHHIIENWEAQDEQEHLKTIKNRILDNEERAGYLLDLYQKFIKDEQVKVNNSLEETELQLSGLVVKKADLIQVYNPIYAEVFNETWIDIELNKLRPYSESYRAWLHSGKTDESRLLQGKALVEAETWASGKNLGGEDQDFLGASRARQREAEAKRKVIYLGSIILGIAVLLSAVFGTLAWRAKEELQQAKLELQKIEQYIVPVEQLNTLAQQLEPFERQEITNLLEQLPKIKNASTKVALRLAIQALAYVYLEDLELAKSALNKSFSLVHLLETEIEDDALLPIRLLLKKVKGDLRLAQGQSDQSFKYYNDAFSMLEDSQYNPYESSYNIFSEDMVVDVHEKLVEKLESESLDQKVKNSLLKHYKQRTQNYIRQLETLLEQKNWKQADQITWNALYYSAQSNKKDKYWNWRDTSCNDFKRMDNLWYNHSGGQFGFKEQLKIYSFLNNKSPEYGREATIAFTIEVGWYTQNGWKNYSDLNWSEDSPQISPRGHLPALGFFGVLGGFEGEVARSFADRDDVSSFLGRELHWIRVAQFWRFWRLSHKISHCL
ncbi:AAA-like domain-containing protein [Crocosphaera sp. Alani8]|uniref:AAA-like domain-containing protein n=1 Tax=Crocosphaera sp. Alani8 TaxID=3038952 RepID=UPI00313BDDB2